MSQTLDSTSFIGTSRAAGEAVNYAPSNGSGNYLTVELDRDNKYMVWHTGYTDTGNTTKTASTKDVKCRFANAEPTDIYENEAGSVVMEAGQVIYPIRGLRYLSFKVMGNEAVVIHIRRIESQVAGHEMGLVGG